MRMPRLAENPANRFPGSAPQTSGEAAWDWSALLRRLTPDAILNMRDLVAFTLEGLGSDGCLSFDPAAHRDSIPRAHAGLTALEVAELAGIRRILRTKLRDHDDPVAIEAAETDPLLSGPALRLKLKSVLLCPVQVAPRTKGWLVAVFKTERRFERPDLDLIKAAAGLMALEHLRAAAIPKRGDTLRRTLARLERARNFQKTLRARIRKLKLDYRDATAETEQLKLAIGNLHRKQSNEKADRGKRALGRVRALVEAPISKLRGSGLTAQQAGLLDRIETCLHPVSSPLEVPFSSGYYHLTPAEIKVASLIKQNLTNKEIGEMLEISSRTVEVHRNNIRRKFGIRKKNVNLRTHLLTLE
jgi:DNA-binding CsgD family transcriptional regulator